MCISPYWHRYTDYLGIDRCVPCPCGHCIECVKDIQDSWKVRLIEEDKKWKSSYFFTLTYRDSSLPMRCDHSTGELLSTACKRDVQLWLKRFRTNHYRSKAKVLGVTIKDLKSSARYAEFAPEFAYFICAEYGPNGTHRPHYHGIIFTNLRHSDVLPLFADWRKRCGFVKYNKIKVSTASVNKASAPANYVAKYCCKGEFASRKDDIRLGLIEKAWRIMSKSLGANYLTADKIAYHKPDKKTIPGYHSRVEACCDRLRYHDGQYSYKLPRFYKERIFYDVIYETKLFPLKVDSQKYRLLGISTVALVPRQVKRRVVRNTLPLEMQNELRSRLEADYSRRFAEMRALYPSKSDGQIHLLLENDRIQMVHSRALRQRSQIHKFYFENSLKHKEL